MKMELQDRDKKLLIFLSIFVIVVCIGYWGIYPALKSAKKYDNEIEEQKDLKEINKNKVNLVLDAEGNCEAMEAEIQQVRAGFFPMMSSDEIDKYFTSIILDYNLYAYDLDIKIDDEVTDLKPYQYSQKAKDLEALEQSGQQQKVAVSDDFIDDVVGVYTVSVKLRVGGDEKDLEKLINDLSNTDQQLRICSFSWSNEQSLEYGEEEGEYKVVNTRILNLSLEIFMCEE